MKRKISPVLLFPALLLFSCSDVNRTNSTSPINDSTTSATLNQSVDTPYKDTVIVPEYKWVYNEKEDEMTGKTMHFASISSNEQLYFHSPYDGGTDATLMIRKKGNNLDVMLIISQGQFLSNIGDDRYVKVRFDDETAQNYSYSEPSDYSSTTIFISNEKRFVTKLKKAKILKIQSEFYNEGLHIMEFDVEGFKWDY